MWSRLGRETEAMSATRTVQSGLVDVNFLDVIGFSKCKTNKLRPNRKQEVWEEEENNGRKISAFNCFMSYKHSASL